MEIGLAILGVVALTSVLAIAWRWAAARLDAERERRMQQMDEEWDELAPILRYILDAPQSEYGDVSLSEAVEVTRKKLAGA